MQDLFAALALVLVMEGILPFLTPGGYRSAVESLSNLDDDKLRKICLGSMIAGLILQLIVKS